MKRFLITSHVVFVLVGIATTMLGPILPLLAKHWHLSDGKMGLFFIAQFLGGFVGSIRIDKIQHGTESHDCHNNQGAGSFAEIAGEPG